MFADERDDTKEEMVCFIKMPIENDDLIKQINEILSEKS